MLSERRGSITVKQQNYLCALYREGIKQGYCMNMPIGLDMVHLNRLSMQGASIYIGILLAAQKNEWKK